MWLNTVMSSKNICLINKIHIRQFLLYLSIHYMYNHGTIMKNLHSCTYNLNVINSSLNNKFVEERVSYQTKAWERVSCFYLFLVVLLRCHSHITSHGSYFMVGVLHCKEKKYIFALDWRNLFFQS